MNWKIEYMNVKPVEGSFSDVVVNAGWRCVATDQNKTVNVYGSASFSAPGNPFTPYTQLTEQQVLDWVWASGVNKTEIETNLANQLNELINPPIIQPSLPW